MNTVREINVYEDNGGKLHMVIMDKSGEAVRVFCGWEALIDGELLRRMAAVVSESAAVDCCFIIDECRATGLTARELRELFEKYVRSSIADVVAQYKDGEIKLYLDRMGTGARRALCCE